jgi:hypothetical protein
MQGFCGGSASSNQIIDSKGIYGTEKARGAGMR